MPEQTLRRAPPLPATKADLATHLTYKRARTIIDDVQEVNALLWDDPEYRRYFEAYSDEQAVSGDLDLDYFMAAQMIKAKARELGMETLANAKEKTIYKALRRVIFGRHEGVSYKDRQEAAEGNGQRSPLNEEEGPR
jgi:hypothetical protein